MNNKGQGNDDFSLILDVSDSVSIYFIICVNMVYIGVNFINIISIRYLSADWSDNVVIILVDLINKSFYNYLSSK